MSNFKIFRQIIRVTALAFVVWLMSVAGSFAQPPVHSRPTGPGIPIEPGHNGFCSATYWSEDDPAAFFYVELTVWDPNGSILAVVGGDGWNYAHAHASFQQTVTGPYVCVATLSVNGFIVDPPSYYEESLILTILDITISAFIPDNHYPDPRPWASFNTGGGDDRDFNRWGDYRAQQTISIVQPWVQDDYLIETPLANRAGVSNYYDIGTSVDGCCLTQEAKDDMVWGTYLYGFDTYVGFKKLAYWPGPTDEMACEVTKLSTERVDVMCWGDSGTALFWSPDITWELPMYFAFLPDGTVQYEIQGAHDGFPNYEVYAGDWPMYLHDYRWYNESIWSLWWPSEFGAYESGELP